MVPNTFHQTCVLVVGAQSVRENAWAIRSPCRICQAHSSEDLSLYGSAEGGGSREEQFRARESSRQGA